MHLVSPSIFCTCYVFVFKFVCVGGKERELALMAFCVVYDITVVGTILCYKSCRQPHQSFIWHYANSSVFFCFFPLFLCLNVHLPSHSSGVFFFPLTVPLTVARFSLIELYSHSNLLKSVLAVTSTIEVVGSEAFKKKKKMHYREVWKKGAQKNRCYLQKPCFLANIFYMQSSIIITQY